MFGERRPFGAKQELALDRIGAHGIAYNPRPEVMYASMFSIIGNQSHLPYELITDDPDLKGKPCMPLDESAREMLDLPEPEPGEIYVFIHGFRIAAATRDCIQRRRR